MFYKYKTSQALEKYLHCGYREGVFSSSTNTELILRELRPRLEHAIYNRTFNCYFLRQTVSHEKTATIFSIVYSRPDRKPIRGFVTVETLSFKEYLKIWFKRFFTYWIIDNAPYCEDDESDFYTK